ncbi:MAG: arylamine N-acetyltransferase [Lachnospiraceae bacterium]|nr:arylamine N-acetyltransferase [Lachnospiraceae bacterium]MDD3614699.1 arylamine N-acetyltransferase [Lachnospiraceae bacterium]
MTSEQINQFYKRIGLAEYTKSKGEQSKDEQSKDEQSKNVKIKDVSTLDAKTLNQIIWSGMTHIPFENFDVYDEKKTPDLTVEHLYKKIVEDSRGGYCFESNHLLFDFLESIGYEIYPILVRIVWGRGGVPTATHRAAIVTIEQEQYYCDIGYGGPAPRGIVKLDKHPQQIRGEWYEVMETEQGTVILKEKDGEYQPMFLFENRKVLEVDFELPNFYCATAKECPFTQARIANLCTEDGSIALMNNKITIRENGKTVEIETSNPQELSENLYKYFDINYRVISI